MWVGHADGRLIPLVPQQAPQPLEGTWVLGRGSQEWRRVVVRPGWGPGSRQGPRPSWYRTHSTAGGSRGWNSSDQALPSGRRWACPPHRAPLHTQHKDRCWRTPISQVTTPTQPSVSRPHHLPINPKESDPLWPGPGRCPGYSHCDKQLKHPAPGEHAFGTVSPPPINLESSRSRFRSRLYHLKAARLRASHLNSPTLSFFCETGIMLTFTNE